MKKNIINTKEAPAAIGPYSQATIGNGTIYVSGQLPINARTGEIPDSIEDQVKQSLENIITIIENAGSNAENILKCGLFIKDMELFTRINKVYEKYFQNEPPARFVVEVSELPKKVQIEIDAIALEK